MKPNYNMGMKTVKMPQVYKPFGAQPVVDDVSFKVKSGETFGMVEPNSVGKATIYVPWDAQPRWLEEPWLLLSPSAESTYQQCH